MFVSLPFLKTFRGASLSTNGRYTRVPDATRRETRLRNTDKSERLREVNCLCRTRVVKKQLLSRRERIWEPRLPAGDGGLPGVYLAEAVGEPSIAKENNYPSTVCVSCGARSIKINIGFAFCSLLSAINWRACILVFVRVKLTEDYRSFLSN